MMCSLYRREHYRTLSHRRLGHRAVPVMRQTWGVQRSVSSGKRPTDVRFGSKADMCGAKRHVRFVPIADMCSALAHVRFTPNSGHRDWQTVRNEIRIREAAN